MKFVKAAALAATLAPLSAFAASTLAGSYTETQDTTAAYLVWADPVGSNYTFQAQEIFSSAQTVAAGTPGTFSVTDTTSGTPSLYSVIGVYQVGGVNTGVFIGANSFAANFGLLNNPWPFSSYVSEQTAMTTLLSDNAASLLTNLGINSDPTINADVQFAAIGFGSAGTLVNFSNGTNGGSVSATSSPVPEPLSCLALAAGAGVLLRRRRS